jgi:serine/threonine-protein kinase
VKKTLGKYRLIAEIGRGGMATAFLAASRGAAGIDKLVVIKQPRMDIAAGREDIASMFINEARISARLGHPSIVDTHAVELDPSGIPYLVMEYLEGQPLNRVRTRLRPLPRATPILLHALSHTLAALHYVHELRDFDGKPLDLVHRDATPHNIFVTYDGHVKLMDFGIAKTSSAPSAATRTGVLKGKIKYLSPEQIANQPLDRRADIYAIGVVLWETLARRAMFDLQNDAALLHQIAQGTLPRLIDVNPDVPAPLAAVASCALAHDRDARYATALEMQEALDDYLDDLAPRVTPREIAAAMSETFAKERREMSSLIEQHILDVRSTDDSLPILRSAAVSLTPSTGHSLRGVVPMPSAPTEARAQRSTAPWLAVGAAVAASALVAVVATQLGQPQSAAVHASPDKSESSPAGAADLPAAPARSVQLTVRAAPATAHIYVDDVLVGTGAYCGQLAGDSGVHRVRIEAVGFESRVELVETVADTTIDLELRPIDAKPSPREQSAAGPRRPVPPVAPGQPPPKVGDFVKKPAQPTKPVDTENPYR